MTGALKRWEKRPKAWSETWQCLHFTGPTKITAELQLEGGQTVPLTQEWPHGALYGDASGRAAPAAVLSEHGWDRDLPSFRPFLAYAELATMFDTLSSLYDALTPGARPRRPRRAGRLARRDAARLRHPAQGGRRREGPARRPAGPRRRARRAREGRDRRPQARPRPAGRAAGGDARATREDLALLRRLSGLALPSDEQIRDAFQDLRVAEREHADASDDRRRPRDLARHAAAPALAVRRRTEDCPVCRRRTCWTTRGRSRPRSRPRSWSEQATALTQADAKLTVARRRVESLLDGNALAAPKAAQHLGLAEELELERGDEAATQGVGRASCARSPRRPAAELERSGAAWQELAGHVRRWLAQAQEVEAKRRHAEGGQGRREVAQGRHRRAARGALRADHRRAIANWRELRQGSSVDLHEITLKKVGRGGRADFDVRADDTEANALGVMSQGELLALSVSVFLPRAALDESPFRFAVIDDPVQAMDPSKVDGLARVLHRAARTRQIVVFTHDDRLPEAIRRLRLDATMLHVDRRARPRRRRAGLAQPGPALPRRRARLREAGPAAARGPGPRRADVLPQRGRGRRGDHRPPPRGRARHRASTRPTSRSPRRAPCARRSRSCSSARPAARARSATRSAAATARPPAAS